MARKPSLFADARMSDVNLVLIESNTNHSKTIPAHKAILGNVSSFFEKLFTVPMQEATSRVVKVEVLNLKVALKLIEWCYQRDYDLPDDTAEQAEAWLILEPRNYLCYPGKAGNFVFSSQDKNNYLISKTYISKTSDSLIKEISFQLTTEGYRVCCPFQNLDYSFDVEEREKRDKKRNLLKAYFKQYQIDLNPCYETVVSRTPSEALKMASLFLQENFFEPKDVEEICQWFGNQIDLTRKVPVTNLRP
jgi:hypothetical protein